MRKRRQVFIDSNVPMDPVGATSPTEEEWLPDLEDSLNQQDKISPQRLWAELRQRGLRTPKESVTIVRKNRDGREGH